MYYVYILKSVKNGRYYVGCTNDIERRLLEHNSGYSKGSRLNAPFELLFKEEYNSLTEARGREKSIKMKKSRKYIKSLINGPVVQLGERLTGSQEVGSSILPGSIFP